MVEAERVERVLDPLRRRFRQDGGDIELLEVTEQEATVRVADACGRCFWSHLLLEPVLERVIRSQVPELERVRVVQDAPPETKGDAFRSFGRSTGGRRRPVSRRSFSEDAVVFGCSSVMQGPFKFLHVVADSESTVLITGETGTGKEVLAQLLHRWSGRAGGPFVPVSCATLSELLVESELFGHERGAFTGAVRLHRGRFERARGGTLFLDDIDDLSPVLQVKLLRVLQQRRIERVGGQSSIPIDVRLVAGSKLDLREAVRDGRYREDLFHRLNVIPLIVPPLRRRREDIPAFAGAFLARFFREKGMEPRDLSAAAREAFIAHSWPGNVRELENACERIAQTCACDPILVTCVPASVLFDG